MQNSRNKKTPKIYLLCSVVKPHSILLNPACDANRLSGHPVHTVRSSRSSHPSDETSYVCVVVPMFKGHLLFLIIVSNCKSRDAGISYMPRSCKVLLLI